MKRKTKRYFRAFYLSLVILLCLSFGWIGISTAYENTAKTKFGEERSAIEFKDGKLRILDLEIG